MDLIPESQLQRSVDLKPKAEVAAQCNVPPNVGDGGFGEPPAAPREASPSSFEATYEDKVSKFVPKGLLKPRKSPKRKKSKGSILGRKKRGKDEIVWEYDVPDTPAMSLYRTYAGGYLVRSMFPTDGGELVQSFIGLNAYLKVPHGSSIELDVAKSLVMELHRDRGTLTAKRFNDKWRRFAKIGKKKFRKKDLAKIADGIEYFTTEEMLIKLRAVPVKWQRVMKELVMVGRYRNVPYTGAVEYVSEGLKIPCDNTYYKYLDLVGLSELHIRMAH